MENFIGQTLQSIKKNISDLPDPKNRKGFNLIFISKIEPNLVWLFLKYQI